MTNIYNLFYEYSLGNQLLLHLQGVREPVNTWKRWHDMNRYVKRGSKAKAIFIPMIYKSEDEHGNEVRRLPGFKLKSCLFGVSETEGEPIPDTPPREWSKAQACEKLDITEVPFTMLSANAQGYSFNRSLAVSPVAANPMKTWLHEAAHITAGHTTPEHAELYREHRGVYEFEAEGSAYLLVNELDVAHEADLGESRSYIQNWLQGGEAPQESIRKIFRTTETILKAGRVAVASEIAV